MKIEPLDRTFTGDQMKKFRSRKRYHYDPVRGKEKNRAQYIKHRDRILAKRRDQFRLDLYGLSPDGFRTLLDAQSGKCLICGVDVTQDGCVDHDHSTGVVRGVLCRKCNAAIGLLRDSEALCESASLYLRSHRGNN